MKNFEKIYKQDALQRISKLKSKISHLEDQVTDYEWEINDICRLNGLSRLDFEI